MVFKFFFLNGFNGKYPNSYKIETIIYFDSSFTTCAGFDWSRFSILHRSYYWTMFWIWAENSVENCGMSWILLSSAETESRLFFSSSTALTVTRLGVHKKLGRVSWDSWPQLIQGTSQTVASHVQHWRLSEEEGSRGHLEWWHWSSQDTITHNWALLSEMAEHLLTHGK